MSRTRREQLALFTRQEIYPQAVIASAIAADRPQGAAPPVPPSTLLTLRNRAKGPNNR